MTLLGIFIGIAAVVSLVALGDGLRAAITEQFSDAGTDKLIIQAQNVGFAPPGSTAVNKLTVDDYEAIKKIRGFKVVAYRLLRSSSLEFSDTKTFSFFISMPEGNEERKLVEDAMSLEPIDGRMLKTGDKYKLVLGYNFFKNDIFDKKPKIGNKILANGMEFEIIGFLDKMSNPQFNGIVLINEDAMVDALALDDSVDIITGQVINVNDIDDVAERVKKELRKRRDVDEGEEDFSVETPQQAVETFNSILDVVQAVIVGIAAISLLVGGIGIANTMFTSVLERRKEIGIMKAIGARNNSIMTLFLLESGTLGLVGGVLGVVLGIIFAKLVEIIGNNFLAEGLIVARFNPLVIIGALLFGFLIGTLSGIIPARQAAGLPPVDALRK
ncbi:ABC transporter permease [Candidatus Woesearchaeota archaeon]|nr:ABC transporter permease [Candidatus Woesearchaeota archaeon]MBT4367975.1 ABC transporter permease [Candidatus Woesearchaeota archaeon]MBT4712463.1 ABC transporter permease [Candidatus Woesearchaeota archaeon]MBT6639376.1 ABC transporter permease [Candidatus Woesearchaeota archaeon]MBT7133548.1 ABC transporter permease [Candidatus Woesearchaeota archaeon]